MLGDLIHRGADGISQGQGQRHYDFRRGISLGKKEHIVEWEKPNRPKWMDKKTYDSYPKTIRIREFKVKGKIYVTTLLNNKKHPKKELTHLYKLRWQVEINLRSIKSVLHMDQLSCKTPGMIRKEIAAHLLAYNIIRILMAEACHQHHTLPNTISFKGAVQLLNHFMPRFLGVKASESTDLYQALLSKLVLNKVGHRPGRIEPRAVKRRRKSYPTLNNTREMERNKILRKRKNQHNSQGACA